MPRVRTICLLILLLPISAWATDPLGTCHGDTGGGTATSVSCTATITPTGTNHFFIAFTNTFGNPGTVVFTYTDTAASSWTTPVGGFRGDSGGGSAFILDMACTQINSTSPQTFSVSMNQPATTVALIVLEFANITSCTSDGNGVTAHGNTSGPTPVTAGNITTTGSDRMIAGIFTCTLADTSLNTAGSGYTNNLTDQWNATGIGGCLGTMQEEDRFSSSTGTFAGAWTVNASTGTTFACGGSTNRACWIIVFAAMPSTSGASPRNHSTIIKYRPTPHYQIPWDDRRHKLEIAMI